MKILRKAAAAVEAVVRPEDRYRLVAELKAEGVRTGRACHALGVSRPGYYAWASRAPSPRVIRQAWLTDLIGTIHQASRGTYGAPRVHAELVYGHGITAGHNTVSLLMRRAGLAGLPAPSRGKRSRKPATVTDLVRRDFRRTGPSQLQVTDITGHPAREGKVYCCAVLDAWSRRVAGWATGSSQRADLATNALGMATGSRTPAAGSIIHGDHGTQTIRATAKLAALTGPDPGQARTAHDSAVARALAALTALGFSPEPGEWTPPACGAELRSPRHGERLAYPHDLRDGEHGFQIGSCSGSHALVRLAPEDDARYVLDLGALNGRRVLIGRYTSPATPFQGSLF